MILWPADVVADLARRRAVLVLGAGVSMNSLSSSGRRPKGWAEFLNAAVARIAGPKTLKDATRRLIKEGDVLTACDIVRSSLGKNAFGDLVREEFLDPKFQAAAIHRHIEQIDVRFVITPNFDKIYDSYVTAKQSNSVIVKSYRDEDLAECMRLTQRVIIKMHGTVDAPNHMIFTRRDYAKARSQFRACYDIISALMLTHTFIFVGCGIADPDAAFLLEDYAFRHEYGRHHYLVTSDDTFPHGEVRKVFEETRNLRFLEYPCANHHQELTASLEQLASLVVAERLNIASTQNW